MAENVPYEKSDEKAEDLRREMAETTARRQSIALNIVENPLQVSLS